MLEQQMKTTVTVSALVSACPNESRLRGAGVSGGQLLGGLVGRERLGAECQAGEFFGGELFGYEVFGGGLFGDERPSRTSTAVSAEAISAGADESVAAGAAMGRKTALVGQQHSTTQHSQTIKHHSVWVFRGPDPWRCHT